MKCQLKLWIVILFMGLAFAQDQQPTEPKEEKKAAASQENETQRNTRALSLETLKQADKQLLIERQNLSERQRHIDMLIDELKNDAEKISSDQSRIRTLIEDFQNREKGAELLPELIAHYEKRDPKIAAGEFIELFNENADVATQLIVQMKKKRSAALMDEVGKLDHGKEVAVKIYDRIGERTLN